MQQLDVSPPKPAVPRSWFIVSLVLNLGAAIAVVPHLLEGSKLTRERFEVQGGEGENIRAGWFGATPTGAELVLGDAENTARLVVEGAGAKLHFGPEAAPSLSLAVSADGASIEIIDGDRQIVLEATDQRSKLEVTTGRSTVLVQADAAGASVKLVDAGPGEGAGEPWVGPRTVEVSASEKVTSIVASRGSNVLRYAVDGDSPSLEMRSAERRALIEVVPRPRLVLESESGRFELGRDPKNPNILARWEREGRVDTWPPERTEVEGPAPATEAK